MTLAMTPGLIRATRWVVFAIGAVTVLRVAQCDAVRHADAEAKIHVADSSAAAWKNVADSVDRERATATSALLDTLAAIRAEAPRVIRVVEHARALGDAVTIGAPAVSPAVSPREQPLTPGSSATDTVAYDHLSRANDPQPYIVPRFVSDLLRSQRAAIDTQASMSLRLTGTLSRALSTIATDSGSLRARDSIIANLRIAEAVAKREHAPLLGFKAGVVTGTAGTLVVVIAGALLVSHAGK